MSSHYGKSKADSDQYILDLIDNGASVNITYPTMIMGPEDLALSAGNGAIQKLLAQGVLTSSGIQIIDVRV